MKIFTRWSSYKNVTEMLQTSIDSYENVNYESKNLHHHFQGLQVHPLVFDSN